jgi:glycerophosphoryl diester phosphodiesterase
VAPASRPSHPFFDFPGPLAFAHRGGASEAPENTLPAFQNAVDLGYRYLETDVHVTADGVVVAFHDDDLSRTCGRPGLIHELPWAEVATARVDGKEPIPRLDELLDAFPDHRINIDCKTDAVVEPLGDVLDAAAALDRVCVGGFSDLRLRRIRQRFGSRLCSSAGPVEIGLLRFLGIAAPGVRAAQVPTTMKGIKVTTSGFVRRCHQRGVEVHVWTIDDPSEMDELLDLGVDGIMTDRPAILKDVLLRRSAWVA